jgi:DNA mismatch endonuclease (patch repair protein)
MRGNKRRDTVPELAIRRAAHASGLRYRVDARPLPDLNRRADLVFTRTKVAVFVDGCYWHGCPEHGTVARTNADYWASKILRNRERDQETNTVLAERGWVPLRIWEHETVTAALEKIVTAVHAR